jgi:CheY-like chemotaxis protein
MYSKYLISRGMGAWENNSALLGCEIRGGDALAENTFTVLNLRLPEFGPRGHQMSIMKMPPSVSKRRFVIADDQPFMRKAVRKILEAHPGWEVCGEASDGEEAVEKAKYLAPDFVVMDLVMPGLGGLDAARRISEELPEVQVLILTLHSLPDLVKAAREAGAKAFVLKSESQRRLVSVIEQLAVA